MKKSNVPDFETATGTIDYGFTNDYVFRKILQENNDVLKALICSILHMEPDGIKVTVTNTTGPIVLFLTLHGTLIN